MKKALVHDWYYTYGGAEKVVQAIHELYPDVAPYSLFDFLSSHDRNEILSGKPVTTSFIQKLPTAKKNHRKFLQLFPFAIEQFDLSEYDLVLSSSSAVAKGVLTHSEQLHLCYCHSPMRYAWDLYHQYLTEARLTKGIKGLYAKYVLHKVRQWDVISANRVDHFIANSRYIAKRIEKIYRRKAEVIYPPVDLSKFTLHPHKEDYYFTASRMVPYKKMEHIVRAFGEMPSKKLYVGGTGPDFNKIAKIAKDNVTLLGFLPQEKLIHYLANAKAFVFAAKEDFGILPVEAQACGTPVIGYGQGGVTETVVSHKTGILFQQQEVRAIVEAVHYFETQAFDPYEIRENALRFSKERFKKEFDTYVQEKYTLHKSNSRNKIL